MVSDDQIKETVVELLRKAVTKLPADVENALNKAYENETSEIAKKQLKAILDNIKLAEDGLIPICQDTGIHIFFVKFPKGTTPNPKMEELLREGIKEATKQVPLRPNAVNSLTRENPKDNTGLHLPYINYEFHDKDYLEITVMPKGAGAENMSTMSMLKPSQGIKGIKQFVLDTLVRSGSNPCPPVILGVGIGGSSDIAMKLAKEALLRPINERHEDQKVAQLETELMDALSDIGIGPMGLGGKTTLLGLNIEYAHSHTATLPVGVCVQCWAARRATVRIYPDGKVEYPTHGGK